MYWLRQPVTKPSPDTGLGEPLAQHLMGQEVGFDELTETSTDLILAVRDDCGVGDWQAQRMAEQCCHSKPVGERTDHRRLCKGSHVPNPTIAPVDLGDHEHNPSDHEHRRCEQLHLSQTRLFVEIGLIGLHAANPTGGRSPGSASNLAHESAQIGWVPHVAALLCRDARLPEESGRF